MNILINFFLAGSFIFLCFAASEQNVPIRLSGTNTLIFLSLVGCAFFFINLNWFRSFNLNEPVNVPPENMADYLNKKLFSKYPYIFSVKPTSGINLSGSRLTNLYAVRNKSFAEFFITYFDEFFLTIIIFMLTALPILFANQQAPSYLSLANRFWIGFGILGWLITVTWFSCLSIIILRLRCAYFLKKHQ